MYTQSHTPEDISPGILFYGSFYTQIYNKTLLLLNAFEVLVFFNYILTCICEI